ncbi:MAG TPA: PqiC family protein [Pseudomonas sp.]|uniref:PqiC family protein n=1 Tax=Pseudomonas sp. TaxID=306 RepID=UPI002B480A8D|nr:PqiC family protein [Pseudomonas sp.]HKS11893.1 PqiC family protein [Pseudomonas sp.]
MIRMPTLSMLIALLALGACRGDPIQFHTLTPAQPGPATQASGNEIQIESISVPPQVDRPQIVIREGSSGLAILETQWWGASLVDELRSALVDQLSNTRPAQGLSLRLDVQRFDSIPGQYALMDARWRLRARDASSTLTCRSTLRTRAGPSIDEVVLAQQDNVRRLALLISQAAVSGRTACPTSPVPSEAAR